MIKTFAKLEYFFLLILTLRMKDNRQQFCPMNFQFKQAEKKS